MPKLRTLASITLLALAACNQSEPKLSRGGYDIPTDAMFDKFEAHKLKAARALMQVLREKGDKLKSARTIYVKFYGNRNDLDALKSDPIFENYLSLNISPHEPFSGKPEYPFELEGKLKAIPSEEFAVSMERPLLLKAFEYDVFYDGWGADLVNDKPS